MKNKEPQITHRGKPQPKKQACLEITNYKIQITNKLQITNYKKIAIKSWCLKCFLKEVFQDAIKKFLPKKQEIK
jgi:hypothetical protein